MVMRFPKKVKVIRRYSKTSLVRNLT